MALGVHPYYIQNTMHRIHKISDHLWFVAGDSSTDLNWYTKRAYLSSVFVATELYFIQDKSEDYADSYEFLHNRLNEMFDKGNTFEIAQNMFVAVSKGLLSIASAFAPEPNYKDKADEFQNLQDKYKEKKRAESENKAKEDSDKNAKEDSSHKDKK